MADKVCLFPLGTLLSTPGAALALLEARVSPLSLVARHLMGDFGDLCEEDRLANQRAVEEGSRVLSSYVKRIKGVSKGELARVAERELQGKRWLPKPLRSAVADEGTE
jgi:hypothetical protein